MRKRWLIVLAVALLALLAVPAVVLAQSGQGTAGYYPAYSGLWDVSAQNRVAGLLGVTSTELLAQLQGGATLSALAEAKGVPTASLVATILAPQKDMLDLQVKYGRLTPEQAQLALETVTARVEALVQTTFVGTPAVGSGTGFDCPMMGGAYAGDPAATPGLNAPGWGGGGMMGGGMMGRGMMGGWGW